MGHAHTFLKCNEEAVKVLHQEQIRTKETDPMIHLLSPSVLLCANMQGHIKNASLIYIKLISKFMFLSAFTLKFILF